MPQAWEGRQDPGAYLPKAGKTLGGSLAGSLAAPAVSKTGATAHLLATIIIPAGSLIPGDSMIQLMGLVKRVGANGTANLDVRLGNTNSTSDNLVSQVSLAATTNLERKLGEQVWIGSKTGFTTSDTLVELTSTASIADDRTTNFDTTVDNYLSVYISSANAADTFNLIGFKAVVH